MPINVFVLDNVSQHLAIPQERPEYKVDKKDWRSLCGTSTDGMFVSELPLEAIHVNCPTCNEQIGLLRDIDKEKEND